MTPAMNGKVANTRKDSFQTVQERHNTRPHTEHRTHNSQQHAAPTCIALLPRQHQPHARLAADCQVAPRARQPPKRQITDDLIWLTLGLPAGAQRKARPCMSFKQMSMRYEQ